MALTGQIIIISLASSYLREERKYRFIEFSVFDYNSLPYLLPLLFWSGVIFPLIAPDKISIH